MQPDTGPAPGPAQDPLADARAHHEAGRLREAEAICRDVLAHGEHAEALHRLGIIAWQTGRADAAIELLQRAVAQRSRDPELHHDLGNVLHSRGKLDEALACYRRTLDLAPTHAVAHLNAGTVLQHQGRRDEAAACYAQALVHAPDLADAHVNLGTLEETAGRPQEAVVHYERALALAPRSVHALYNLGNALRTLGRLDEAAVRYREAIAADPAHVMARVNLGAVLRAQARYDDAARACADALSLRADFLPAHYGLALALEGQGRLEDAIGRYRKALRLERDHAGLHNDLGAALARLGRMSEACAAFRTAVALQPDFRQAHSNLGHALYALGDVPGAVACYRNALARGDNLEIAANLAQCLRVVESGGDVPDADALLLRALTERWGRPDDLALAIARRVQAAGLRADDPGGLSRHPLLNALLERAPIVDASLERFLTEARRRLLDAASEPEHEQTLLASACALATQCFLNEYVFACDADEAARVQALRQRVVDALAGGATPSPFTVAVLGMYMALDTVPGIERALADGVPARLQALLAQQVTEPRDERRRAAGIAQLTDIHDPVSLAVRRQYEANPYPRWSSVARETPASSPDAWLRGRLPGVPFLPFERRATPEILIAGCGTGREAVEMAQRFPAAQLLAIDLSRASLAYAERMSEAHGVRNVRYAQADIALLASFPGSFDVISSVGVLHHMADPHAALRALVARLRPGGFLQVGLYSEAARRHVAAAQRFVAEGGYAANVDGIRRARAALRAADDGRRFADVTEVRDFYTTSECRDLLFHVHEQRFTLPRIRDMVRDLGVRMLGFVLEAPVVARYAARFPEDIGRTQFDSWAAFEAEHPDTFAGMYVFWVQKP